MTRWWVRRGAGAAVIGVVVVSGALLAAPTAGAGVPGAAGTPECVDGSRTAAAQIGSTTPVTDVRDVDAGGARNEGRIKLRWASAANCAWPWMSGGAGSTVWVDRERPTPQGTVTDRRLDPRDIQFGNGNTYGAAHPVGGGVRLRACGSLARSSGHAPVVCTDWFDGRSDIARGSDSARFVALGDSFAAGQGAGDYESGTDTDQNACHRSSHAYPVLLGTDIQVPPRFVACSGATTGDVIGSRKDARGRLAQSAAVRSDTELVTFTVGGNDGTPGFADVARSCALTKEWRNPIGNATADCMDTITAAGSKKNLQSVHDGVTRVLDAIHSANRNTRVIVVGYPRVFPKTPTGQCRTGYGPTTFLIREMRGINVLADQYNAQIRQAIVDSGRTASFVDVTEALRDHDLCAESDRWINRGFVSTSARVYDQGFHPDAAGQRALYVLVRDCYNDRTRCRA